jgi:hypothetical protein
LSGTVTWLRRRLRRRTLRTIPRRRRRRRRRWRRFVRRVWTRSDGFWSRFYETVSALVQGSSIVW